MEKVELIESALENFKRGFSYENGLGVNQDRDQAVELYQVSAEQGNVWAQYKLGICYAESENYKAAAEWCEKAANQGNEFAQNDLGAFYETGLGVEQDYRVAAQWYEKAARQGNKTAENNLFRITVRESEIELTDERSQLEYYTMASRLNLLRTSRTAEEGEIDISASGQEFKVSKESIGRFSPEKIEELEKNNEKAKGLDLNSLKMLSKDEIKKITIKNFESAIMKAFELAQKVKKGGTLQGSEMESFIEQISKQIGAKIVKEEDWFRKHDSKKYPYTKFSSLKEEFSYFCNIFVQKLTHIPDEKKAKKQWAMETAAWVEYRINLTDHFMTDSCGKVASVMSTFVCILGGCSLPIFSDKTEYLAQAPKRRRTLKSDDSLDKKYKKWEMYYLKKFPNNETETFQLYLNPENQGKYYRQNAFDNLMIISKTSKTGIRSTSGYANKKAQIKELSQIEVKPLVIAQFSSLIDYFFQQKTNEISEDFISQLLKYIACQLNEKSVEVNADSPIESFFRTQDGEHPYKYPYTSYVNLGFEFKNFLGEINERLKNSHKYNILETLALIHYRIFLHHHFFKDGNNRIAIAFVTYVCIRGGIRLPKFSESDSLKKYYNREEVHTDLIGNDPQFGLWFSFYKSLFTKNDPSNNVLIDAKEDFEDGWDVTVEKTLDKEFTIYEVGTRSFEEIEDMRKATGIEAKKLILFTPKRMLLHEIIIFVKTNLKIDNDDKIRHDIKSFFEEKGTDECIKLLELEFEKSKKDFQSYVSYVLEDYFHLVNVDQDLKKRIKFFSDRIQSRIKHDKCNVRLFDSKTLMINLVVDDLLRDFFKEKVYKIVKKYFDDRNMTPDQFLKLKKNFNRSGWAIVGGPASGKSSLKQEVYKQIKSDDGCCVVNPDDYKPLLETNAVKSDNIKYAALVHEESSYITDEILKRLDVMVKADNGPNILLDIVTSSAQKMNIIGYGGATVYLNIATCPVEGLSGAVNRAFNRAKDQKPDNQDRNRYVPTRVILEGHRGESVLLPDIINQFKLNLNLVDTTEKGFPKIVAVINGYDKHLKVYEPILFFQFIKKALINIKASFEEQAYLDDIDGTKMAELFVSYVDKGITISLMYGETVQNPKISVLKTTKKEIKDDITLSEGEKTAELKIIKHQIKQLEKQNTFAVFSLEKGIVCNDYESLCKIFPQGNRYPHDEVQDFLLYFIYSNIQEKPFKKLPLYLYTFNGECIFKRDVHEGYSRILMVNKMPENRDVKTVYLLKDETKQEIVAHYYNGSEWNQSRKKIIEMESLLLANKIEWSESLEIEKIVSVFGCVEQDKQVLGTLKTLCPAVFEKISEPALQDSLFSIVGPIAATLNPATNQATAAFVGNLAEGIMTHLFSNQNAISEMVEISPAIGQMRDRLQPMLTQFGNHMNQASQNPENETEEIGAPNECCAM